MSPHLRNISGRRGSSRNEAKNTNGWEPDDDRRPGANQRHRQQAPNEVSRTISESLARVAGVLLRRIRSEIISSSVISVGRRGVAPASVLRRRRSRPRNNAIWRRTSSPRRPKDAAGIMATLLCFARWRPETAWTVQMWRDFGVNATLNRQFWIGNSRPRLNSVSGEMWSATRR